ncbi:MAG: glycosyltransferase family 4 protein [Roseivirga sp.]|nr:glycosyltransferase family 4 protein [Roseivirga sp.]
MSSSHKIYFFSPYDIQRPRTNQLADVHFCEGLQQAGCELTLFVPTVFRKENVKRKKINETYGVEEPFRIRYLFTPTSRDLSGRLLVSLLSCYHCFIVVSQFFKRKSRKPVIISRNPRLMYPLVLLKKNLGFLPWPELVLWMHEVKLDQPRQVKLYSEVDRLLCTNSAIKEDLAEIEGITAEDICVTLNPVTAAQAREELTKKEAREKLKLDETLQLVVYTGKLFIGHKEADYIVEAARLLPQYHFLLTGGKPEVVRHFQDYCEAQGIGNMTFTGYAYDYTQIRYYQQAADVLVSYYTPNEHIVRYNFPLKIMEYMLTGNPIVTPDFASTRDVLNSQTAIFCQAENTEALANAIGTAFGEEGQQIGTAARMLARKTTYKSLGIKIKAFIFENTGDIVG